MTRKELVAELLKLDPEERMRAAEELFESVAADLNNEIDLTPEQLEELDRRIEEHERDPSTAVPWEAVRAKLLAKFE